MGGLTSNFFPGPVHAVKGGEAIAPEIEHRLLCVGEVLEAITIFLDQDISDIAVSTICLIGKWLGRWPQKLE